MGVYIIIASVCLLLIFFGKPQTQLVIEGQTRRLRPLRNRSLSYKLLLVSLFAGMGILTAFRSVNIGNDTISYYYIFKHIADGGVGAYAYEPGFMYFTWFISRFFNDPHIYFIVCAAISYALIGNYIFKRSYNIPVSICFFFTLCFGFYMTGLRQSLAMLFVLYAYDRLKQEKKIQAFILIILGSLFHSSALLALVFFACDLFPRRITVILWIMLAVAALSATGAFNRVLAAVTGKYAHFFETEKVGSGWLAISVALVRNAVFFYFTYRTCAKNWERWDARLAYANVFMLLLCICLGYSINIFSRVCDYFLLIACVDVPNVLCYRKDRRFWNCLICIVLVAYFFVAMIFRPEWNYLYPYEFWN